MPSPAKPRHYVDILKNYQRLIRLELDKRHAVIESAPLLIHRHRPASDPATSKPSTARPSPPNSRISPELIGGLRIKIGSDVWDGSVVATRLEHAL